MLGNVSYLDEMSDRYSGLYAQLNGSGSSGPIHQMGIKNGNKSFTFRKRFDRVDWKRIAAVDIDSITRNLDFRSLQENIMNVTFCNIIAELDVRTIDPNFIKLYKLAQLIIEYLLHSQDYLSGAVTDISQQLTKEREVHGAIQTKLELKEKELVEVKKESHKRKKMLLAQQHMLQAGANSYNKCPYCSKAFLNLTFLQSHLARRHTEHISQYNSVVSGQLQQSVSQQPSSIQMPDASTNAASRTGDEELRQALNLEMSKIKDRLQLTESQLQEERNTRNNIIHKEQVEQETRQRDLEQQQQHWQQEQLEKHKEEVEHLQEMFMRELKEMNTKYSMLEESLHSTQKRKKSQLGTLQDDVEEERAMLHEQRTHIAELSENLQHKLESVESMKLDMERHQKALNKQMVQLSRQQKEQPQQKQVFDKDTARQQKALQDAYEQQEDQVQKINKVNKARPVTAAEAAAVDESEDDETTGMDETSTMGTATYGTLGTGEMSMTGTRSLRLVDELKKNPTILQGLKRELQSILERELEKRGVSRGLAGVTTPVFNDKMTLLKQERQLKAKKHHNFLDLRQQYLDDIELLARQQLKIKPEQPGRSSSPQQRSPSPSYSHRQQASPGQARAKPARPAQPQHQVIQSQPKRHVQIQNPPSPAVERGGRQQGSPVSQRSPAHQRGSPAPHHVAKQQNAPPVPQRETPTPAPRSTSPTGKLQHTGSTMSSTAQSRPGTVHSSPWDSDSEESEEEESYEEETEEEQPPVNVHVNVPRAQRPAQTRHDEDEDDDEEDDNWDSISDLEEVTHEPQRGGAKYSTTPGPGKSASKNSAGGEKVMALSRSIELQLSGRGNKKPAGGVNTMPSQAATKKQSGSTSYDDDEEDFPSISSLEDETASVPQGRQAAPRRSAALRGSAHDTSASTNTYNTSLWGSSAKGGSTAPHGGSTAGRTSVATMDDWDDDGDDFSM